MLRFHKEKDSQQDLAVKKDLRKIKMKDVDLTDQNYTFYKQEVVSIYKIIWSKNKKLHSLGKINNLFILGDFNHSQ